MKIVENTLLIAAAAIGLLAAAAAPAATASPPTSAAAGIVPNTIQYFSKSFKGPVNGGTVLGTVGCPAGTFVVNISADSGGAIGSMSPLRGLNTPPRAANFTAAGVTGAASVARPLFVKVGCLPSAQLTDATALSVSFGTGPTDRFVEKEVRCPNDRDGRPTFAFGGGGNYITINNHYSTAGQMQSNTVTKDGRGWLYRGRSTSPTDKLVVTTQCAPLPGSTTAEGVAAPQQLVALAFCPPGRTALSGGMENIADVFASSANGSNWGVVGNNAKPLIARTQCIPGSPS